MTIDLGNTIKAQAWFEQTFRPVLASAATDGTVDALKVMEVLNGLDGVLPTLRYLQQHAEFIKAAVARARR